MTLSVQRDAHYQEWSSALPRALAALLAALAAGGLRPLSSQASAQATAMAGRPIPTGVETHLAEWLSRAEPFGITGAVAVLRDTVLTLAEGFGPLNPDGGHIGPDTPFLLASLSKQFTATAILQSAAAGHLRLTDSIAQYFPDTRGPVRHATIAQLLSHTSGMVYIEPGMFDPAPNRPALMRELLALPLDFEPGARYSYSSPGYAVLAGILEIAEHKRFEDVLTERIFRPAGMTHTTFMGRPVSGAPNGVQMGEDQGPMSDIPGVDRAVGNGSVISTARDLARWEVALRRHTVLDERWTRELFTPRTPAGAGQYAFGWNITPTPRGTTLIYHAGDLGPFNAEFRRYVDDRFTLIWLSNARLASSGTRAVVTAVAAGFINGTPVTMPPLVAPRDTNAERSVSGRYVLPHGDTLVVTRTAGGVAIAAAGAEAVAALGGGEDAGGIASRVASALEALQHGNDSAFAGILHPAVGASGVAGRVRQLLSSLADSIGSPVRLAAVGFVPTGPGAGTAWVRARGPLASLMLSFGATGGRLIAFPNPTPYAAEQRLRSAPGGGFVAFDPLSLRVTSVARSGDHIDVAFGGAAPVRAVRVS